MRERTANEHKIQNKQKGKHKEYYFEHFGVKSVPRVGILDLMNEIL